MRSMPIFRHRQYNPVAFSGAAKHEEMLLVSGSPARCWASQRVDFQGIPLRPAGSSAGCISSAATRKKSQVRGLKWTHSY